MTRELTVVHAKLFQCLKVTARRLAAWHPMDVQVNQKGGVSVNDITMLPPKFAEVERILTQPRKYNVCNFNSVISLILNSGHSAS